MRPVCHARDVIGFVCIVFGAVGLLAVTRSEWWRVTLHLQGSPRQAIGHLREGDRVRVDDVQGDIDERVAAFVAMCGVAPRPGMRFRESTITPGETVAVWGTGTLEPDPSGTGGGYRQAPMRLRIAAWRDVPLLISDRPSTTE